MKNICFTDSSWALPFLAGMIITLVIILIFWVYNCPKPIIKTDLGIVWIPECMSLQQAIDKAREWDAFVLIPSGLHEISDTLNYAGVRLIGSGNITGKETILKHKE